MTDEELEKKAWEIYREALKLASLPDYVKAAETQDGKIVFTITIISRRSGAAIFQYCPSTVPIEEILEGKSEINTRVGQLQIDKQMEYAEKEFPLRTAILILQNFYKEVIDVVAKLDEIPMGIMIMSLRDSLFYELERQKEPDLDISFIPNSKKLLEEFLEARKQRTKDRIMVELVANRKFHSPVSKLFAHFYETDTMPRWKRAIEIFKKNQDSKRWAEHVTLECKELPPDLVERLRDVEFYHRKSGQYRPSPSPFALEHAARLCGFPANSLQKRALHDYLKESRDWIKAVDNQTFTKELAEYERYNLEFVREAYRIAVISGKEPDIEMFSYSQKIISEKMRGLSIKDMESFDHDIINFSALDENLTMH